MCSASDDRRLPSIPQLRHLPAMFWGLLALTAVLRLVAITRPLLGNFATKNVVYGMIARNWAEGTASIWYPTLDVLRGGQKSLIMLEFPVSAYLSGLLWKVFGGSLDIWGRATAVGFSVGAVGLMYLLVARRHGPSAAIGAATALAVSPVGIIYGQSFMLEASLIFFTLATFYALDRWQGSGRWSWLNLAGISLALLLLTKVYMGVILLPLMAMAWGSWRDGKNRSWIAFGLVMGLALVPAVWWYAHALHTAAPDGPMADRIFFSVRHSAIDHRPPHPLLRSADFYRQLLDDLTGVVLTPIGFGLLLIGLADRRCRQYAAWLAAMGILVAALPRKFHEMNYYWMAVLPPLCIMVGIGWETIRSRLRPSRTATALLCAVVLVFSLRYSARPAFVTPPEDRAVRAAARAIRERTDPKEPIVTLHGTSIDLIYYCGRSGWTIEPDEPNRMARLRDYRRQGANWLVTVGQNVPELEPPEKGTAQWRVYRLPERETAQ